MIKRWLLRIRYAYLRYRYPTSQSFRPDLQYLLELTKLLYFVDLSGYIAGSGQARHLEIQYADIGEYTKRFQSLADLTAAGTVVAGNTLQNEGVVTNLDRWLTESDGRYVNPVEGVKAFHAALERLLRVAVAHQSEKVGVHAANRRVMRQLYLDAELLTESLIGIGMT